MKPYKRRVAEDVRQLHFWNDAFPINPQGVAVYNRRALCERQPDVIYAYINGKVTVYAYVGNPEYFYRYYRFDELMPCFFCVYKTNYLMNIICYKDVIINDTEA